MMGSSAQDRMPGSDYIPRESETDQGEYYEGFEEGWKAARKAALQVVAEWEETWEKRGHCHAEQYATQKIYKDIAGEGFGD